MAVIPPTSAGVEYGERGVEIRRVPVIAADERGLLRVLVTKPGTIGKYTRFTIRPGAATERSDRCLTVRTARPISSGGSPG